MVFHSKGTWGCAAKSGILSRTPGLAKSILFGNVSLGKGKLFGSSVEERSTFGNSSV